MTADELLLRRLFTQHFLHPADTQTVVKDLCGVQAQFLSHALHGLSIRCTDVNTEDWSKVGQTGVPCTYSLSMTFPYSSTKVGRIFSARWIHWNLILISALTARHTLLS